MCCSNDLILGVLALFFPPLAVWVKRGLCSADSIINILLCVLGYIPGLLHAWYIIAKYPDPVYEYEVLPADVEGRQHVFNVYVNGQGSAAGPASAPALGATQPPRNAHMSYGATAAAPSNQGASSSSAPAGPSDGSAPPSYTEVIAGDNKIQH